MEAPRPTRRSGGPNFRPAGFGPTRPAQWFPHAPLGRATVPTQGLHRSLTRELTHALLTHSQTRPPQPLTHSLARSRTRSLARSLAHSPARSLARPLAHPRECLRAPPRPASPHTALRHLASPRFASSHNTSPRLASLPARSAARPRADARAHSQSATRLRLTRHLRTKHNTHAHRHLRQNGIHPHET